MTLKPCCATGSLHTGTPTGRFEKKHGLDCYVAEAPNDNPKGIIVIIPDAFEAPNDNPKGIIVIIPDAFGIALPNNQILADDYAKHGFTVYLPEFMDGAGVPSGVFDSMKYITTSTGIWNQVAKISHIAYVARHLLPFLYFTRRAVCQPRIFDFLKAMKRNEANNLPIGTAGFCWGGQHVTALCHDQVKADDGGRLTVCGFVAHPSFLTFPTDIEGIVLPYSCAAAEIDQQMSAENAQKTKEILQAKTAKNKDQGIEHEFVMYDKVHHGFAVRADENDKLEAEAGKKAEGQAVRWFEKWFTSPTPS